MEVGCENVGLGGARFSKWCIMDRQITEIKKSKTAQMCEMQVLGALRSSVLVATFRMVLRTRRQDRRTKSKPKPSVEGSTKGIGTVNPGT